MPHRLVALGAAALIACGLALTAAGPAHAHNVVIDSTPTEGQVLTELPGAFSITTNEPLLELDGSQGFAIQIRDADGKYYGDGCVTVSGATLATAPALGDPGDYTMLYQAVSADGHTIDGEISFTWSPLGTVGKMARALDAPPVCGVDPEPSESSSPPTVTPDPVTQAPASSGIDLATVLWIGGALLALGLAAAIAIAAASRRQKP